MVNQILTRQELMLSFLLQALIVYTWNSRKTTSNTLIKFPMLVKRRNNFQQESSADEGETMYNVLSGMSF